VFARRRFFHTRSPHMNSLVVKPSLGLVITGTGTGIGKTHVSCALLEAFTARGQRCLGLKPVETGYTDPEASDAAALARSARHPLVTPCFTSPTPQSPHRVARDAGVRVPATDLAAWVHARVAEHQPDIVVVETAGGLFTPLSEEETNLDLVASLGAYRFALVALDRLGALHDVLVCTTAAAASLRAPDFVYLNVREPNASALGNSAELCRLRPTLAPAILPQNPPRSWSDVVTHLFTSVRD
jgi:dethiobiotin synthetase